MDEINCSFTAAALLGQCPRAWAGTRLPPRHERCMTSEEREGESQFRNSDARPQRNSDAHRTSTDLQGGDGARPTRSKPGLETTQ